MSMSLRKAGVDDVVWMAALLREGAQEGHFLSTVGEQAEPFLTTLLQFGGITMLKLRQGREEVCTVHGEVWVADWGVEPASFLICMDDQTGYEIHLSATRKAYRRRGCFSALVRHAIANGPSEGRIYARCYEKSIVAISNLQRMGFELTSGGDPIELDLKRMPPAAKPDSSSLSWWRRFMEGGKRSR